MSKQRKGVGKPRGGDGEVVVELEPRGIYFTFSRIRPTFSCGRPIQSTMDQFLQHELTARDLPLLCVFTDGTDYFSQNNRRLYLYKKLEELGELRTIPVRLRPLPNTRRMAQKYSRDKCSLTATLMGSSSGGGGGVKGEGGKGGNEETSEEADRDNGDSHDGDSDDDDGDGEEEEKGSGAEDQDTVGIGRAQEEEGGSVDVEGEAPPTTAPADETRERLRRGSSGLRYSEGYQFGRVDSLTSLSNIPLSGEGFVELSGAGGTLPTTITGLVFPVEYYCTSSSSSSSSHDGGERKGPSEPADRAGRKHAAVATRQGSNCREHPPSLPHHALSHAIDDGSSDPKTGMGEPHSERHRRHPHRQQQQQKQQQQQQQQRKQGKPSAKATLKEGVEEGVRGNEEEEGPLAKRPKPQRSADPPQPITRKGKAKAKVRKRSASSSSSDAGGARGKGNSLEEELMALGLRH